MSSSHSEPFYAPEVGVLAECANAFARKLPPELRTQFRRIFRDNIFAYGLFGTRERLNGRTISQIIAECQCEPPNVVTSGNVDGVGYTLYEESQPDSEAGSGPHTEEPLNG